MPLLGGVHVKIAIGDLRLDGELDVPPGTVAMVVFAHGSGSSRLSPRNRHVAEMLQDAGLGTLLFDPLTPGEEEHDQRHGQHRFDIDLLAERLAAARLARDWFLGHLVAPS